MPDAPSARYTFLGSLPRWLAFLPLAAFAVTLALTPLVPIYTDEVGWKIITARLFRDGGVMISLFPRCGKSFALQPPWFMMPTRTIEALAYADFSLMRVRIMGVLSLLAWMALTLSLLRRMAHTDARSASGGAHALWPAALLTAFLGLGALPFLLVLNRPEQPLLIGLTLFLLVPLVMPEVRRRWTDAAAALGCLVVAAMLFAAYPKSLLFAPLILAGLFIAVRPLGGCELARWRCWVSRWPATVNPSSAIRTLE